MEAIRPQLLTGPVAVDTWASRLADYAATLIDAEAARRGRLPAKAPRKNP